jgi:hypothetical protein
MFNSFAFLALLVAASSIESASVSNARNFFAHYSKPFGVGGTAPVFGGVVPLDDKTRITKVFVKSNTPPGFADAIIVSLQFQLIDSTGAVTLTQKYGGDQEIFISNTYEFNVPTGEYITKVEVNSGDLIDGLKFITDKG